MDYSLLLALSLGDGFVGFNKNETKGTLHIRHSNHQLDYIHWKYNLIPDLWSEKPRPYKNILNGKRFFGHYLRSLPDSKLADIRRLLYPNTKKEYTREALELLTPLGLAIWYMDDGCVDRPIGRNAMGILNTYGHSPDGLEEIIIQKYFKEVWDITLNLNKNHGRYRLRLPHVEFVKFVAIIESYVIASLKYKIDTTMRLNDQAMPDKG